MSPLSAMTLPPVQDEENMLHNHHIELTHSVGSAAAGGARRGNDSGDLGDGDERHNRDDSRQGQELKTISTTIVFGKCPDDEQDTSSDSLSSSSYGDDQSSKPRSVGNQHRFRSPMLAYAIRAQQRRTITLVQRFGVILGICPVVFFAFEMADGWCHACTEGVTLEVYVVGAAICGGVGAVLYANDFKYWMAQLAGGATAALGALLTIYMLLQTVHSNLVFLFLFVGILGAFPGLLAYFLVKIISDELSTEDTTEHYYEQISPLTLPLADQDHAATIEKGD